MHLPGHQSRPDPCDGRSCQRCLSQPYGWKCKWESVWGWAIFWHSTGSHTTHSSTRKGSMIRYLIRFWMTKIVLSLASDTKYRLINRLIKYFSIYHILCQICCQENNCCLSMAWNKSGTWFGFIQTPVNKVNSKLRDIFYMLWLTAESSLRYNSGITYGWRPDNTAKKRHQSWRADKLMREG